MKTLFDASAVDEVMARIEQLRSDSQRQWGKMDAAQMMAHCSSALDMASGKLVIKRTLIGRIIGPRFRHLLTNDEPMAKNNPTAKELRMGPCDFTKEHERLRECVRSFHKGGESKVTTHQHPFFGPLTSSEWGTGMYKHLDHHLKQFGV